MKILTSFLIALAVGVVSAPVLADQAGDAAVVAQADGDHRVATLGDINRLDEKIENVRRDLGVRIDMLGARIDMLTTAVWTLLGVIIAGLLGVIAVLIPALHRRDKASAHSAPLSPQTPASAAPR